jgi:hypothetical protein
MTKRKEYMEIAEKAVRELAIAYYNEHGKFPDRYSVLKSALTRSYKNMLSEVSDIITNIKNKRAKVLITTRLLNKY